MPGNQVQRWCARFEIERRLTPYRGFKSHPVRHFFRFERPVFRDALQQPVSKDGVEVQFVQMDVADVAATDGIRAHAWPEAGFEVGIVDVSQGGLDEMTAPRSSIAIHGEARMSGMAGFSPAGMLAEVCGEMGINRGQEPEVLFFIVARMLLQSVHPQIGVLRQQGAQPPDMREMLLHAHGADAVADAHAAELVDLRYEALDGRFSGMEGAPQGDRFPISFLQPLQAAGEIGLNGGTFHMRHATQP